VARCHLGEASRLAAATGTYLCFEDEAGQTPVILVWHNLNTHLSTVMRTFTQAHPDWPTAVQLPAYAPDLNPVEGIWANPNHRKPRPWPFRLCSRPVARRPRG
jgi:DDE superfamily endonuclease